MSTRIFIFFSPFRSLLQPELLAQPRICCLRMPKRVAIPLSGLAPASLQLLANYRMPKPWHGCACGSLDNGQTSAVKTRLGLGASLFSICSDIAHRGKPSGFLELPGANWLLGRESD